MKNEFKTVSLDTMIDKHVGKLGTTKRETFENELRIDLLGEAIRQARKERHLTQEQLGKLVGVQKAQISKIENSVKNARFETILKVFEALGAKVNFNVEMSNKKLWDSVLDKNIELSNSVKKELDRRIQAHQNGEMKYYTREELKEKLQ